MIRSNDRFPHGPFVPHDALKDAKVVLADGLLQATFDPAKTFLSSMDTGIQMYQYTSADHPRTILMQASECVEFAGQEQASAIAGLVVSASR